MKPARIAWKKWLAGAALIIPSMMTHAAQVDLLLLYDDFTANRYNGNPRATLESWVNNANTAYRDSQVDIQLRLVGLEKYSPSASGIGDRLREIRNSSRVDQLRNQYGADFVSLISSSQRVSSGGSICGIGNLAVNANAAFNVTGIQCGYLTLIHELGHNMGLTHSRKQGDRGGARYRYGIGYGIDNNFSTIMAYPQAFNARTRLNRFSDPNRNCEGIPCGVPIGQPQEADAHTALNNVRADISNFRAAAVGGNPSPNPTPSLPNPTPTSRTVFGLQPIDSNSATLYHVDGGQSGAWNYLCLNSDCMSGTKRNGRFERTVFITPGSTHRIEFKVQDNTNGQCITSSSIEYSSNGGGTNDSSCD